MTNVYVVPRLDLHGHFGDLMYILDEHGEQVLRLLKNQVCNVTLPIPKKQVLEEDIIVFSIFDFRKVSFWNWF